MSAIETREQLEAIYGETNEASTVKVADKVTPPYRIHIDNSPFAVLATSGRKGWTARRAASSAASYASMTTRR